MALGYDVHGHDHHLRRGRVLQVDPMKSTLKAPRSKRLKLEHEKLLSNFAFNFNLRRYAVGRKMAANMLNTTLNTTLADLQLDVADLVSSAGPFYFPWREAFFVALAVVSAQTVGLIFLLFRNRANIVSMW
jgi:hypothetical protein